METALTTNVAIDNIPVSKNLFILFPVNGTSGQFLYEGKVNKISLNTSKDYFLNITGAPGNPIKFLSFSSFSLIA